MEEETYDGWRCIVCGWNGDILWLENRLAQLRGQVTPDRKKWAKRPQLPTAPARYSVRSRYKPRLSQKPTRQAEQMMFAEK